MRTVRLGRTGVEVPAISLGTWSYGGLNENEGRSVGWSGHDDALARAALIACWGAGITHWDTADVYGDGRSERVIGQVWDVVPRDDVFLASKVGWDPGPHPHYYTPELVRSRIARSLENLRTDRIDLFYLHHCDFGPDGEWLADALVVVREARDAGEVRFIGLSDWDPAKVARYAPRVEPDVVQPYRCVAADAYEASGLRAWVDANDAGVAFFSPIRHGLLLGKYEHPVEFPLGDFRRNVAAFQDADTLAALRERRDRLRERFAARPQPVLGPLLNVLLADAPTGCVLLGLRSPEQVAAAVAADAELTEEEVAFVRELYADVRC